MPQVIDTNINTPEHYDYIFSNENFRIDITQPLRAKLLLKGLKKDDTYLDLACGLAPHFLMAYVITGKVWASDFSSQLIKERQNIFEESGIRFVLDDIRETKLPKNYFDYISAGEILEHFENPYDEIEKIVGLLVKGGKLSVSVPDNDMGSYASEHHIWSFKEKELEKMLGKYGKVKIKKLTETEHNYLIGYLIKR